ncbi:UDP-glycosyltransferase 86A1 [Prunus yedoensis var. nudiflora]|uniref:Glycosyltransferase n=1 Tax=Prunus yedoensis var. nudiflora TaxID=2094558 RepID=A0A314ZI32_PRUYE|nr:UDP-glycosyltransferase 86A1 [Prunus yedoensis var. nudiflora]
MENNTSKHPHAVLFAYPLQGHVIPAVHLAIKLASKGITVTFVNTEAVHHQIVKSRAMEDDNIFNGVRQSGLDIRYVTINDGFPVEFDRSLNHDQFWESVIHDFPAHVDELLAKLVLSNPPVNCLISDTFFEWPTIIASKYNLVTVSFWTEPALVFNLYYHLDLLNKNGHGHFTSHANPRQETIDYIPGVHAIEPKDLSSYLQPSDYTSPVHRIIVKAFEKIKKQDFILCNTVQELESETVSALQEKQQIYSIGPIFPTGFTKSRVATSLWSESDCIQWLSTRPRGSVFKVGFIWVLRPDIVSSDEPEILPVGFEDEIKDQDQGLIVPWCSQIEVISHPSIGGFITHCGWNSILESIWCNLPLLCFPLLTDQFTNRKLVVDDWRVGLNLCDQKPITKEEVAEKISRLMMSADELRRNVKEVRKALEGALAIGGSSYRNLDQFIDGVKTNVQEKTGFGFKTTEVS